MSSFYDISDRRGFLNSKILKISFSEAKNVTYIEYLRFVRRCFYLNLTGNRCLIVGKNHFHSNFKRRIFEQFPKIVGYQY